MNDGVLNSEFQVLSLDDGVLISEFRVLSLNDGVLISEFRVLSLKNEMRSPTAGTPSQSFIQILTVYLSSAISNSSNLL
ncbi:hypothetical protein [Nostoc sp. MG11]|uniref:hypothetical protein n=1 Tax=Nostoc sp. MG11 TaxID=2721166 RepID=UPI0018664FC8|nr:hypothetical protein [Nostoc sp. MG11]